LVRLRVDRPAVLVLRPFRALGRLGTPHDEAVDDHLDRVALVLVERGRTGEVVLLAIDAHAHEALLPCRLEDPIALGLAVLDERPEHEQAGALRHLEHLVDDLLDGLALDRMAVRAVRDPDAREQQAEVVVDLSDGTNR
jgi:hypothetical protein